MRILLVSVPWAALEVPSAALGILRRRALDTRPGAHVDVLYANLTFADWMAERTGMTVADYNYVAQTTYFVGVGDWVFTSALYDDPHWRVPEFRAARRAVLPPDRLEQAVAQHRLAPEFIDELAERIVAGRPDVVGLTSTFQQNTAALALARQVKRRLPGVVTVLGGANCDGPSGAALHRNFRFLDYVCRGEAEASFAGLLAAVDAGRDPDALSEVAGLCWRRPGGDSVANPMAPKPLAPAEIVTPEYADYFSQLAASKCGAWVGPKLVVEGARGCWWGEKQHCTFCGLNGSSMTFRSKPPERFRDEVLDLVARHQVLDMYIVDNIMDMSYLTTFLPMLIEAGHDLRMQCEVKSNLRYDQLEVLAQAGAWTLQPGIESLSSRVLRLMRKGVTGYHNVRLLRDAESLGLSLVWNYLYGFPEETPEDYLDIIAQLPALHHLSPAFSSGRIALERFSPYFEDPSLGFPDRQPDVQYRVAFDLPDAELYDLAYLFQTPSRGIGPHVATTLDAAVEQWREAYPTARFCFHDLGDTVTLVNTRAGFGWRTRHLTNPVEVAAFRALDQPRTAASLARAVTEATGGGGTGGQADAGRLDAASAADLLRGWRALGIVFEEDGRFIQLATRDVSQDLFHLNQTVPSMSL